jgi:hypothetical protein
MVLSAYYMAQCECRPRMLAGCRAGGLLCRVKDSSYRDCPLLRAALRPAGYCNQQTCCPNDGLGCTLIRACSQACCAADGADGGNVGGITMSSVDKLFSIFNALGAIIFA